MGIVFDTPGTILFENGQIAMDLACCCIPICCRCQHLEDLYLLGTQLTITFSGAFTGVCDMDTISQAGTCAAWELGLICTTPFVDLCSLNLQNLYLFCPADKGAIQAELLLSNLGCDTSVDPNDPTPILSGHKAKYSISMVCDPFYAKFVWDLEDILPGGCGACTQIIIEIAE